MLLLQVQRQAAAFFAQIPAAAIGSSSASIVASAAAAAGSSISASGGNLLLLPQLSSSVRMQQQEQQLAAAATDGGAVPAAEGDCSSSSNSSSSNSSSNNSSSSSSSGCSFPPPLRDVDALRSLQQNVSLQLDRVESWLLRVSVALSDGSSRVPQGPPLEAPGAPPTETIPLLLQESVELPLEPDPAAAAKGTMLPVSLGNRMHLVEAEELLQEGLLLQQFVGVPQQLQQLQQRVRQSRQFGQRICAALSSSSSSSGKGRIPIQLLRKLLVEGLREIPFIVPECVFLLQQLQQVVTWRGLLRAAAAAGDLAQCEEILAQAQDVCVYMPGRV